MKKLLVVSCWLLAACSDSAKPTQEQIDNHSREIEAWQAKRVEELKGHEGWLNLAGLFWLNEGINSFGSAESNDVVFPAGKIAPSAGYFKVNGGIVTMAPVRGSDITMYGAIVENETIVFHPDSADAIKRKRGPVANHGSLEWYIIRREDKLGIRLRDLESPAIKEFKGIERYPVDYSWRIPARFEPGRKGETIDITNVLGQTITHPLAGRFVFQLDGKETSLSATSEGQRLFIIFGDPTNDDETYGAGRFLYTPIPDSTAQVFIDFNRAENPPCAFTEFATCPMPPRQNVLPVRITAGEKNYGVHTKQITL